MEHFYKTRKQVVCVLFILTLCLLAWCTDAKAQYIDLKGSDMLDEPVACKKDAKVYVCAMVRKDKKDYLVLVDQKGEAIIFKVVGKKAVLIWMRDTV